MRILSLGPSVASIKYRNRRLASSADRGRRKQAGEKKDSRSTQKARVLIVDRDLISNDLFADVLGRNTEVQAIASQPSELSAYLAANRVALVVIASELQVEAGSGFDLAEGVSREFPNVAIVLLLNQSDRATVLRAFRCGAHGVFCRDGSTAEFLSCIESVLQGSIWAGRRETIQLLEAIKSLPYVDGEGEDRWPMLTGRELSVVQCAATGKTNKAIASELGLSEHTVKNYLFRAFEKLGVSSRVELLFCLTQRGHKYGTVNRHSSDASAVG